MNNLAILRTCWTPIRKIFCKIKILVHLLIIIGLLKQPDSTFENILYKIFFKNTLCFRNISLTTEVRPMWLQVVRNITSLCWTIMSKYRHRRCSHTSLCGTMCIQLHLQHQCIELILKLNLLHQFITMNSKF